MYLSKFFACMLINMTKFLVRFCIFFSNNITIVFTFSAHVYKGKLHAYARNSIFGSRVHMLPSCMLN
jgi:hypothetical protein